MLFPGGMTKNKVLKDKMKLLTKFTLIAFTFVLISGSAFANQADCCKKAADAGKRCNMKCCVAAAKDGKECEKCGGSGKLKKPAVTNNK
ncbi:MAG: hypothetical protein JWR26_2344 [Pedosphaera sp.]|nr:hypothetical protein [Pedosphaera sp.]